MRYWRKIYDKIGYIIFDESQRSPSKVLTTLIPNFDCRYVLGLSNSVQRKDRLLKLINFYLGDIVYTINEKDAREGRGIITGTVVARPTDFSFPYNSRTDFPAMLKDLMENHQRNLKIVEDVETEIMKGKERIIVLSGGGEQDDALSAELSRRGVEAFSYNRYSSNLKAANYDRGNNDVLPPGAFKARVVLISPGALPCVSHVLKSDVIFLAVPVYFQKGLSNALRDMCQDDTDSIGNRLTIYDYVDSKIGILENYFRMRSYSYGVHPDLLLSGQISVQETAH
jgi:hypothetical protein